MPQWYGVFFRLFLTLGLKLGREFWYIYTGVQYLAGLFDNSGSGDLPEWIPCRGHLWRVAMGGVVNFKLFLGKDLADVNCPDYCKFGGQNRVNNSKCLRAKDLRCENGPKSGRRTTDGDRRADLQVVSP